MSSIKITRGNDAWAVARKLQVYIDDSHVGNVRWNETVEFPISLGEHIVHVKMDWCQSAPLKVEVTDAKPTEISITIPTGQARWFSMIFAASRFFGLKKS
jgi:hypothetical protein